MGTMRKVKKNDLVEVISGNEKGKRGKVMRVITDRDRAIVVKKANRVRRQSGPTN